MIKLELTVEPFFMKKATDNECIASYLILVHDDGQKSLEKFIG